MAVPCRQRSVAAFLRGAWLAAGHALAAPSLAARPVPARRHLLLHHHPWAGDLPVEPLRPAAGQPAADHAASGGGGGGPRRAAAPRPLVLAAGADHPALPRDGPLPGLPPLPPALDTTLLPAAAGGARHVGGLHPHPRPAAQQARAVRRRRGRPAGRVRRAPPLPAVRHRALATGAADRAWHGG